MSRLKNIAEAVWQFVPRPVKPFIARPIRRALREVQVRRSLSPERLTGTLAIKGGRPVRDVTIRPWPGYPFGTNAEWKTLEPVLKQLYLTGQEGLPQPLAREFERQWAAYCGTRRALLLPHGTDALRIALAAALDHDGLDYGGEVIVPNLSFVASCNAALDRRLGVCLVDVDPQSLLIDPARVEEAIVPGKTRAIMAVHLAGQPADMTALREIARRHSLALIEDAAQAHGAIHDLGRAGALGDAAAFSFQGFKNLPSGEGGALTTDDEALFERAYMLHNVGRALRGGTRWGHKSLGWNVRPTEYVAAVLLQRLKRLEGEQAIRERHVRLLLDRLSDVTCLEPYGTGPGVQRHALHLLLMRYRAELCDGLSIDDFVKAVNAEGVPLFRLYHGTTIAQQPAFQALLEKRPEYVRARPTPVADRAVQEGLLLQHDALFGSDADLTELAAAFRKVHAHYVPHRRPRAVPTAEADIEGQGRHLETSQPSASQLSMSQLFASHVPTMASTALQAALRVGIIGVGAMGRHHARSLRRGARMTLAGVADLAPQAARAAAADFTCPIYDSPELLIASRDIDVVLIATPHWQHPALTIAALTSGKHVICEKPLAVTVADADEVLRAAARARGRFAIVFQNRLEPPYKYIKRLLDSGELGPILRCSIVESFWRTQSYFATAPWRGTWRGEGGGVLVNQAPHVLDRYAWLCGMPDVITARCDTLLHRIEVEDVATALLTHANGAHGTIHVNMTEAPWISRTEIACDRGRILVENGKVRIYRLPHSIKERTANDPNAWATLDGEMREVSAPLLGDMDAMLDIFHDNVAAAILDDQPLACPGQEGMHAVELANAMILSSARNGPVAVPVDRAAYAALMSELVDRTSSQGSARTPAAIGHS